jgi:hypothetical protein
MESAFSLAGIYQEVSFVTFFWTDGVLLEVRNQKAECYGSSLIATKSYVLALRLVLLHAMMIKSLSLCF